MEQRRARHNKIKKEGAIMTENIGDMSDVTADNKAEEVTAETVEDKAAEVIAIEAVEAGAAPEAEADGPEAGTEIVETGTKCSCGEDNKVENKKPEDVTTITKEISHKLYIQYNDLEFSDELMFEAAINAYCNEYGQDKPSVEAVNLYVKPQEGKAYYVINNDAEKTGSIDL